MSQPDGDLTIALELADSADRVARSRFGAADLVVDGKPNGSPVCDADRAIEAAVVARLRDRYPALPIFGQEHGPAFDGASEYWAIDPIDGSASFIAGDPAWGFTACLVRDGEPVVGVASSVGLGRRWWASITRGAFARTIPDGQPLPLHVSEQPSLPRAAIGWWDGWRTLRPERVSPLEPIVKTLRSRTASVVANGAAALAVAEGDLDAAIMRNPNNEPHHSAVFMLLVREAGGVATDSAGDNTVLFSNQALHDQLLALLHES